MTKERAIKILKMNEQEKWRSGITAEEEKEAVDMAVEALKETERNPTITSWYDFDRGYEKGKANARPHGTWEELGFQNGYAFCRCSNCHKTMKLYLDSKNEFCCIADIRKKVVSCMYCGSDNRKMGETENET